MSGASVLTAGDLDNPPNMCPDDVCWVLTTCNPPFVVRAASPLWYATWGWRAQEIVGKASTAILDGPGTDTIASEAMMHAFFEGPDRRVSARLTNLTKGAQLRVHDFLLVRHPAGPQTHSAMQSACARRPSSKARCHCRPRAQVC